MTRIEELRFAMQLESLVDRIYNGGSPKDLRRFALLYGAAELLEALRQIAKGEGRFSRDPLTHASNTIEDMGQLRNCGKCHDCGGSLQEVLDGEEWCPRCQAYRRYCSHGWGGSGDGPGICPDRPADATLPSAALTDQGYRDIVALGMMPDVVTCPECGGKAPFWSDQFDARYECESCGHAPAAMYADKAVVGRRALR